MSHFYAFDRKQSLLLLFAGILLAILALMLGWIIGLLMRPPVAPAPETASRPRSASEQTLAPPADPQRAAADTRRAAGESAAALQARAEQSGNALQTAANESQGAARATARETGSALQTAANESQTAARTTAREAETALQTATAESAGAPSAANTNDPTDAGDRSDAPRPTGDSPTEDAPGATETADASGSLADAIPPDAKPRESTDGTGNGASEEGEPSSDSPGSGSESSDEESDFGPRTRYAVVVADFVVESKARELVKTLEEKGYAGRVVHTPPERTAGRMGLYTVILGDYGRSATAEIAAERFSQRESTTTVVRRFPALALLPPPPASIPAPTTAAEPIVPTDSEGNPESGADG